MVVSEGRRDPLLRYRPPHPATSPA